MQCFFMSMCIGLDILHGLSVIYLDGLDRVPTQWKSWWLSLALRFYALRLASIPIQDRITLHTLPVGLKCLKSTKPRSLLHQVRLQRPVCIWKAWLQMAVWKRLQLFSSFKPGRNAGFYKNRDILINDDYNLINFIIRVAQFLCFLSK